MVIGPPATRNHPHCSDVGKLKRLTVFNEDVASVAREVLPCDLLIGLHHVGAEDLLVVFICQISTCLPLLTLQDIGASSLEWKEGESEEVQASAAREGVTSHNDGEARRLALTIFPIMK